MANYTVIWYDEGDGYMFTPVYTDIPYPSGDDFLLLAAKSEYNRIMSPQQAKDAVDSFKEYTHGLVGVIAGEHVNITNHLML